MRVARRWLDGTGLLYYHARMYDPVLARFVSADSVVPGSAAGGLDGVALKGLTVDFHEPGFAGRLNSENGLGFWFQMSDDQQRDAGSPWGPANPQALNRYSYVQNGPVRYRDPSGHDLKEEHNAIYDYSYSTVTAPDPNHFVPYRDAQGNMVYADEKTGVLYVKDANGARHKIFKICHYRTCKYTYENDSGFQQFREAIDALEGAVNAVIPAIGSGAALGCVVGAVVAGPVAPAGCGVGALEGAIATGGPAVAYLAYTAWWAVPQMRDSFNDPDLPDSGPPPWIRRKP